VQHLLQMLMLVLVIIPIATFVFPLQSHVTRHFWHGSFEDRKYVQRWDVLSQHNFRPTAHMLSRSQDGLVTWAADVPIELKNMTLQYFRSCFDLLLHRLFLYQLLFVVF
jgi:hypothetical protein